jgi:endoglucanase
VLHVPEINQVSPPFDIDKNAYNQPFRDSLRFFYYARSGQEIAEPYAEGYPRPAIYTNNAAARYDYNNNDPSKKYNYDPQGLGINTRDVQGGWFDAADLHLDTHNNITPLWFLLEILERQQHKLGPNVLNLPESDGHINDMVRLIQYQLDWFKKMQNPDGSVHFIVISQDGNQRYQQVSDVSTGAACILAGIFAKAYPLFNAVPSLQAYAQDLLDRAELSWAWLTANPNTYNPAGMNGQTWSYGITDDRPYRGFAAIELYIATGNNTYRDYFESRFNAASGSKVLNAFGGNSYYGYIGLMINSALSKGYMDYARTDRPVDATIRNQIISAFTTKANALVNNVPNRARTYRVPMLMSNAL